MIATNLLFILSWLVFNSSTLFAQIDYQKLSKEELVSAPVEVAEQLANTMLTAQKSGQPYILQESEATPAVRGELTTDKQLQTYSAIRELFGDYQSVTFEEAYRTTNSPAYYIFRFRGKFERDNAQPEVRVVMNEDGQLAGFSIVPWEDNL